MRLANYHMGRYDDALQCYNDAIKKNPDDALVFFNRGNVFLNKGEYELAHLDFDEAIRKESKNPKFWHAKGLAYETKSMQDPKHVDHSL